MSATTRVAHLDLAALMAALTEDIVKGADPTGSGHRPVLHE
jgi:hypothetical protein